MILTRPPNLRLYVGYMKMNQHKYNLTVSTAVHRCCNIYNLY